MICTAHAILFGW